MGHRTNETYHRTEAEARKAQREAVGAASSYSETYGKGVFPCRLTDPKTGEEYDGFASVTETYYG